MFLFLFGSFYSFYHKKTIQMVSISSNSPINSKIGDFGSSKKIVLDRAGQVVTQTKTFGTTYWLPPEVIMGDNSRYDGRMVDVYSFGIVLWEMHTKLFIGKYTTPFTEFGNNREMVAKLISKGTAKLTIDKRCDKTLHQLISTCTSFDFKKRPSFEVIEEMIKNQVSVKREKIETTTIHAPFIEIVGSNNTKEKIETKTSNVIGEGVEQKLREDENQILKEELQKLKEENQQLREENQRLRLEQENKGNNSKN
jgi:serine/threonine protein kinase